jgi:hypothetical protein
MLYVFINRYLNLPLLFYQFGDLKKAFPEIPPGLPFSKEGELFLLGSMMTPELIPSLKKQNKGWLMAFQKANSSPLF